MEIWFAVAVVAGTAEIITRVAALGMVEGAAVVTIVSAAIGLPLPYQFVVFAAAAGGVVLVRPIVLRHLRHPQTRPFGVDDMAGKHTVVPDITDRDSGVRVDHEESTASV